MKSEFLSIVNKVDFLRKTVLFNEMLEEKKICCCLQTNKKKNNPDPHNAK